MTESRTSAHPIPAGALDKHIAILGKTGSGKSNLAKTIAEDLLARGRRVCVVDPTGTWWGLRLMADGDTPSSYPIVIFGGQHGDLPLGAAHGEHIARVVGTAATPAIIDTREMTVSDRTRFFTGFAETLIRENRGELTVVIDEAHLFMPQAGARAGGAAPAMLHAGNNLVSLGRGVGLRIVLISQRPAKLHKDSLTQVETLVAMRLIAPQDRKAIDDWIGEWADGSEIDVVSTLPSLPTGDAWVWSPEIGHLEKARCPLAATYDSGRVRDGENPDLPQIDVDEIAELLEDIGSELLADDPRRLKARIAELERTIRNAPATVDEEVIAQRVDEAMAPLRKQMDASLAAMEEEVDALGRRIRNARGRIAAEGATPPPKAATKRPIAASNGAEAASSRSLTPRKHPSKNEGSGITGPQQRILDALAWLETIGIAESATRIQVAFLAGYKPGGGAFNNTLGSLRTAGLIDYPTTGQVALTEEGRARSNRPGRPLTTENLHRAVMERLTGPQRRILQQLIEAYPDSLPTDALAHRAGYEPGGGAFNNTRGSLRSLGLIDYPTPGFVIALPVLFVEGVAHPRFGGAA